MSSPYENCRIDSRLSAATKYSCSTALCFDIMLPMVRKKRDQENTVRVIIPGDHPNPPLPHEVEAALVLSRHFRSEVEFIVPVDDYKRKSADIVMLGLEWEIKVRLESQNIQSKSNFEERQNKLGISLSIHAVQNSNTKQSRNRCFLKWENVLISRMLF